MCWVTQLLLPRSLHKIKLGVAFNPCPIVPLDPVPLQVTIEKPLDVDALIVEVMLPSVLLTVDDPASQVQAA